MCIWLEYWTSVWWKRTLRMETFKIVPSFFRTNILFATPHSPSLNVSHPSHISWFNCRNGARWRVHTTKLFIVHMATYVMHRLSQDGSYCSTNSGQHPSKNTLWRFLLLITPSFIHSLTPVTRHNLQGISVPNHFYHHPHCESSTRSWGDRWWMSPKPILTSDSNRFPAADSHSTSHGWGSIYSSQWISGWIYVNSCRSRWPRGLRRRSAAARLLRMWVRIPPGGMDVCLLWVLCVVR